MTSPPRRIFFFFFFYCLEPVLTGHRNMHRNISAYEHIFVTDENDRVIDFTS